MVNIYCFHGCGQNSQVFKSLLSSLEKNLPKCNWFYPHGKYYKNDNGWGWYKYDDEVTIKHEVKKLDLLEYTNLIKSPNNTILIGFSEGGQFALDLAQYIPNIKGIVAISPSYTFELSRCNIECPVVLITSQYEDKIMKRYAEKWKKYIKNVIEINHNKGHKVYLPRDTRDIIKNMVLGL